MTTADKHIQNLAKTLLVEEETRSYIEKDFEIIRAYVIDILLKDPIIGKMLINTKYPASNFNCSLVLDLSHLITLGAIKTKYPSFIRLVQRGRNRVDGTEKLPFFSNGENIAGGVITNIVKGLLKQGLDLSGYFVRGHLGDIYELDFNYENKTLKNQSVDGRDGEWQNNYIMLKACSQEITLNIRLRVLIKFCSNDSPNDLWPHPTHNLKMVWLAAADVRYMEYFSLCAPLSERELASSPNNLIALRLLQSLMVGCKIYAIKKNHLESITYELIYTKAPKITHKSKESVLDILIASLRRILYYLDKNRFPYYWDTKENLLFLTRNRDRLSYTHRCLRTLLTNVSSMRGNTVVTYEEVESFFGVETNAYVYNVDDFGVYRHFHNIA
ncbi:PREDICTED: uncharacterized protein LOC108968804 [Bactrocera latifrons]|uniref:Uncharacterized protein n=2 Tax=Bactrocera latifrons TaxID=174628 RepID=A0A0K8TWI7_BACLA|nr:PREDICTED: uncharacterized protein LOC108968804 [Bactrocera latifrons]